MRLAAVPPFALLTPTILSLAIPRVLPSATSLGEFTKSNPAGLRLGSITSIVIGLLFSSLFAVWIGLLIYHCLIYLLNHSSDSASPDGTKPDDEEKTVPGGKYRTWAENLPFSAKMRNRRRRLRAAGKRVYFYDGWGSTVLGTVFGLCFLGWSVFFLFNVVEALRILWVVI